MKPVARNWTPVKNGNIFCSPACGYGCTIEMHDLAQKSANELCSRLNKWRAGWTPYVHENLGWHYRAFHKQSGISVHSDYRGGAPYHAMVEPSLALFYGPTKSFVDPVLAVKYTVKNAVAVGDEITTHTNKFRSILTTRAHKRTE